MRRRTSIPRDAWVSYLRVSTAEQAERELSIPAQRQAVGDYARRLGHELSQEYVESGRSGTNSNRPAFRAMLEDVFQPSSKIGVIVVSHTSRFTRSATEARVIKQKLHKTGVRVVSISQETQDDAMGQLIEGIFECIDQYESELNGLRTSAALRQIARQGFFPGGSTPFGFTARPVEIRPGVLRHVLVPDEHEAPIVREIFDRYLDHDGALRVAGSLNERNWLYRGGKRWSKDLVLRVLAEPAVGGTYYWGKHDPKTQALRDVAKWLPLEVEPIVEGWVQEAVLRKRALRDPKGWPQRPDSPPRLLAGMVRCGRCASSYTLQTAGKRRTHDGHGYRYYNCRVTCRIGLSACEGGRIPVAELDNAVLDYLVVLVCPPERCQAAVEILQGGLSEESARRHRARIQGSLGFVRDRIQRRENDMRISAMSARIGREDIDRMRAYESRLVRTLDQLATGDAVLERPPVIDLAKLRQRWIEAIMEGGDVSLAYLQNLVARIEVHGREIRLLGRSNTLTGASGEFSETRSGAAKC